MTIQIPHDPTFPATPRLGGISRLGAVALLLAVTSAVGLAFAATLGETRLTLLFIMPVLVAAGVWGIWAGCAAAVGAVGLLNFLFAAPRYSFLIADVQDLVTLVLFFPVAVTTGILAGRLREQRDAARAHVQALQILAETSDRLHLAAQRAEVLDITRAALSRLTGETVTLIARHADGGLVPLTEGMAAAPLQGADLYAAELALGRGITEIAAAKGWNGSAYSFLPLSGAADHSVALAFAIGQSGGRSLPPELLSATEVLRQQCATALQRVHFAERAAAEAARAQMQSLRADLLGSLSHDLRSPLAAILGSVTTLQDFGAVLPAKASRDLLDGIESETRRLSAYVANLLQLTRLQAGEMPAFPAISLTQASRAAVARIRQMWPDVALICDLPEVAPIKADAGLIEQALFNLIDNAIRHAGGEVRLRSAESGDQVHITIADTGGDHGAAQPASAGAGLGLRICAAIATACGGTMTTRSLTPRGREVTLSFPRATDSKDVP